MQQPLVTITNFILSALCFFLAWKMSSAPAEKMNLKRCFATMLFAVGAAAFLGGLVHGYFEHTELGAYLWVLTLITIGIATYNLWLAFGLMIFNERIMKFMRWFVRILLVLYFFVLLTVTQQFWIAIISYLPPVLLIMLVSLLRFFRTKNKFYLFGFIGFGTTLVAAAVQANHFSILSLGLDYNSLYHILQGLGLWGVYLFGSRLARWNI
jgi:hypothetical protein